jgi:D-sedoheptulose 7-phosphate isomerase
VDIRQHIVRHIEENIQVKQRLLESSLDSIQSCINYFVSALKSGKKVLFCGNGGSAADAQHIAAELVVRLRSTFNRPAIPALALSVNTSIITAAGNDFGFQYIFSRQVEAIGEQDDILVAISTSGESPNVLEAVKAAKRKKIKTIGFLGGTGGNLTGEVDLSIIVPSNVTARIQETHILIGHILCEIVEELLFHKSL